MSATASEPFTVSSSSSVRSSRPWPWQGLHPYDILCGKDQIAWNNIGNRRFRVTVALNARNYSSKINRQEKGTVIDTVLNLVHKNGGRFYKRLDQTWVELSLKESREKVSHAFRDLRKREKSYAAAAAKKDLKNIVPEKEVRSSFWSTPKGNTKSFVSTAPSSSIEEAEAEVPWQIILFENFYGPQQEDDLLSVSRDLFDQNQAEESKSTGTDVSRASPDSVLDPPEEWLSFMPRHSLRENLDGLSSGKRDCHLKQDTYDSDSVSLISSVSV